MSTNSYSWENKYKKKHKLGEGGNAVVYLVQDECRNEFALKVLKLPSHHLFSKNEFKDEMRKADDRLGNILVIDDEGYVHIVSSSSSNVTLYPTRGETWGARNNFVGKYSSLSCLDEAYLNALDG